MGNLGRKHRTTLADRQTAKHALVNEAKLLLRQREPHTQVPLVSLTGLLYQHLPTHPQMSHHSVAVVQREPQVLTSALGIYELSSDKLADKPSHASRMAPYRSRMEHLDSINPATNNMSLKPTPYNLNLRQLRHYAHALSMETAPHKGVRLWL